MTAFALCWIACGIAGVIVGLRRGLGWASLLFGLGGPIPLLMVLFMGKRYAAFFHPSRFHGGTAVQWQMICETPTA